MSDTPFPIALSVSSCVSNATLRVARTPVMPSNIRTMTSHSAVRSETGSLSLIAVAHQNASSSSTKVNCGKIFISISPLRALAASPLSVMMIHSRRKSRSDLPLRATMIPEWRAFSIETAR